MDNEKISSVNHCYAMNCMAPEFSFVSLTMPYELLSNKTLSNRMSMINW